MILLIKKLQLLCLNIQKEYTARGESSSKILRSSYRFHGYISRLDTLSTNIEVIKNDICNKRIQLSVSISNIPADVDLTVHHLSDKLTVIKGGEV